MELLEGDLDPDPFRQFDRWFADTVDAGLAQPDAMALATATADGRPSVRFVLLKGTGDGGFDFFTNLASRKGLELDANPSAALAFHWQRLHRQVRISGRVEPLSREASAAYFASRPRGAQIAALVSRQSEVIADRGTLDREFERQAALHEGREVALPAHWGGFRLRPDEFEFWQGRDDRLHDRLRYERQADGGWRIERLSP